MSPDVITTSSVVDDGDFGDSIAKNTFHSSVSLLISKAEHWMRPSAIRRQPRGDAVDSCTIHAARQALAEKVDRGSSFNLPDGNGMQLPV